MKTVMIVDDEEDIRSTVKNILSKHKFKVITANDADDCLVKLAKSKPDLILLDIMMPGTPVKEVVPKIKGKIAYITSVKIAEAEREELLKPGNIVGFIQKPFDVDDFVAQVKYLLG